MCIVAVRYASMHLLYHSCMTFAICYSFNGFWFVIFLFVFSFWISMILKPQILKQVQGQCSLMEYWSVHNIIAMRVMVIIQLGPHSAMVFYFIYFLLKVSLIVIRIFIIRLVMHVCLIFCFVLNFSPLETPPRQAARYVGYVVWLHFTLLSYKTSNQCTVISVKHH